MIEVNIKNELAELERERREQWEALTSDEERENFKPYTTHITPFLDADNNITHKHVAIPKIGKTYCRTYESGGIKWYLLNDELSDCDYCNDNKIKVLA